MEGRPNRSNKTVFSISSTWPYLWTGRPTRLSFHDNGFNCFPVGLILLS